MSFVYIAITRAARCIKSITKTSIFTRSRFYRSRRENLRRLRRYSFYLVRLWLKILAIFNSRSKAIVIKIVMSCSTTPGFVFFTIDQTVGIKSLNLNISFCPGLSNSTTRTACDGSLCCAIVKEVRKRFVIKTP